MEGVMRVRVRTKEVSEGNSEIWNRPTIEWGLNGNQTNGREPTIEWDFDPWWSGSQTHNRMGIKPMEWESEPPQNENRSVVE